MRVPGVPRVLSNDSSILAQMRLFSHTVLKKRTNQKSRHSRQARLSEISSFRQVQRFSVGYMLQVVC